LVWNRDVPCKPCPGKTQSCPRECAIDNTPINLGANAILPPPPQLQSPKPGSVDPVAPYKLCQLVDLLHCQNPCLVCLFKPELSPVYLIPASSGALLADLQKLNLRRVGRSRLKGWPENWPKDAPFQPIPMFRLFGPFPLPIALGQREKEIARINKVNRGRKSERSPLRPFVVVTTRGSSYYNGSRRAATSSPISVTSERAEDFLSKNIPTYDFQR